jgi:hypothetical protein
MASWRIVIAALSGRTRRVLVYCGMHPAFTRYVEAELELRGHATNYVDRMDNLLWWRYGEWSQPLEVVRLVDLIPLDEYAPDEASTGEVARHNPFTDESGLTHAQLRQRWSREAAANADALGKRGWANLELAPPLSPVTGLRAVDGCWENR